MNRTLLSIFVTALFAGSSNAVLAEQSTDSPAAAGKSAYSAAQDKAQTTYMNATWQCESGTSASKATCLSAAQVARTQALADAKSSFEGKGLVTTDTSAQPTAQSAESAFRNSVANAPNSKSNQTSGTTSGSNSNQTAGNTSNGQGDQTSANTPSNEGDQTSGAGANSKGDQTPGATSGNPGAKTSDNNSSSKADRTAADAATRAKYKQAMAKCDAITGATKATCREKAEQERRDALAKAATDSNNEGRRGRTGSDDLSANDEPHSGNASKAAHGAN